MIKVRRLIRIVSITIVTIFLIACIAVGVFWGLYYFAPEKCFEYYDFGQDLYAAAKYYGLPHPPSNDWIACDKIKYVQRYLQNEKVQKIVFCSSGDENGWEIVEPEKIRQTLQLISGAKKAQNVSIVWLGRMSIITDKHKFVVPVEVSDMGVYGLDWTSFELRKQLWEWGYDHKVYQYDLPSKEQTVAILLYSHKFSPPLAIFGDKKLADKLVFEPNVRDDPNGIIGLAGLYKVGRLRQFGIEFKKEAGKLVPASAELEPKKTFEGRERLEKIMDAFNIAFKEAEEREKYFPMESDNPVGRIVFMTESKDYWKEINIDANAVYDDYIKSEKLKAYFDEFGLTKELLAKKPNMKHQN